MLSGFIIYDNRVERQNAKQKTIPAIRRAAEFIDQVASSPSGVTVTALIDAVGVPTSTAYRIIRSLTSIGFLEIDEGKRVVIGNELKRYGVRYQLSLDLVSVASPFIDELSEELSETVKMSELRGLEVEVTYVASPSSAFRIAVDVGARFPLHAGAASKLLMAFMPEQARLVYASNSLKRYTAETICDPANLDEALARIRDSRSASDTGEYVPGIHAVAFPIINITHDVVAALSVPYVGASPSESHKREQIQVGARRTATRVSRALGARIEGDEYPADIHYTLEPRL